MRSTPDGARGGWSIHDGESAKARCSVMFSNTLGAAMSRDFKPYIGMATRYNTVWKLDTTATDDAGNAFRAYIRLPYRAIGGVTHKVRLDEPMLLADGLTGCTLTISMTPDFGARSATESTVLLTPPVGVTAVWKKGQDGGLADANYVQIQIGDALAAATDSWVVDRLVIPYEATEAD